MNNNESNERQGERMPVSRNGRTLFLTILAATSMVAGYWAPAAAQGTASKPAGDDLRALYANPEEITEGKRLAEASCAGCHGPNGVSVTAGVPHIAGQRPGYLYIELKAYQSGARGDSAMRSAVKFLNDDALVKVAAYYASLDPAQPAQGAAKAAPADPVRAGKAASAACVGCHGEGGISKIPGMPSLIGLDPKYLVAAMKAYKDGQRKDLMMKSLLASISDADMNHLALYYALEKVARAQTPSPGDQAKGKAAAAAACAGCHGDTGVSNSAANPSLAGQDTEYLAAALRSYRDGARKDDTMKGLVASLDDNAIKDMAAFYANQQPKQPNVRKPLTTDEWAQRCDRCHGLNGNSTDPRMAALAGQRQDYLEKVLNDYRSQARKKSEMNAMSDVLSEDDIKHLAAHYARQRAKAVVFVTLPGK